VGSTCVVGLQWGDEAKGKIVDLLTDEHDIVVRFQGGSNAGHTVVRDGQRYKFSLVPTGILHPGVTAVIANGVVIDPAALVQEIETLRAVGVRIDSNLLISERAHVIFPYHRAEDEVLEDTGEDVPIGTTRRGIGPCYRDKVGRRHGIRIGELLDRDHFARRLRGVVAYKNTTLGALSPNFKRIDADELFEQYAALADQIRPHVTDTTGYLHAALAAGKRILMEGAQGTLLDNDHGTYPFVTSSNSSACGMWAGCGVPARQVDRFLGVMKAYTTRVGGGPFPTELHDATGDLIRNTGREFGTVTGRPRRCGWFDAVLARYSARLCGVDALAVMLLDVLSELDEISICVGYVHAGRRLDSVPADVRVLAECQPIYVTKPGWKRDIAQARSLNELPDNARDYLSTISELVGCPVDILSVGPDRDQTIRVKR
jgi:adenylosuccinate synthase